MVFGILSFLLFVALATLSFVFAGIKLYKTQSYGVTEESSAKLRNSAKRLIVYGIASVLLLISIPFSFHTVDTGEVAVVKHLGKAKMVRTSGTYFDFWMTNSYQKYDGKVQSIDIKTASYYTDAQTMDLQMTLQYKILTDKAMEIASQYGSLEALTTRINAIATEKAKAVLSEHKAMDIIANRQQISPAVEETIRAAIGEEYYVNVTAVVLTNIDFSDAFEQAVEEKMIAEQKQLKADYENQTKVANAEAEAKAKVVQAEAEAKANELLEQALTDKIIAKIYADKWDGKLPEVVGGDGLSMILPGYGETE